MKLEEYRAGNMQQALGRAFLRMDELLVDDSQQEELRQLAGGDDSGGHRWHSLCTVA